MTLLKQNISLLVSVKDQIEIKKITKYVDIIDLKNPDDGPLGSLEYEDIKKIIEKNNNKKCMSATIGNIENNIMILNKLKLFDQLGLDYLKIGIFNDSISKIEDLLHSINNFNLRTKLVAVFFAENKNSINYLYNNMNNFSLSKFQFLLIDTLNKSSEGLMDIYSSIFLESLVLRAKEKFLNIGLAGKIKTKEIPALIKIRPSLIGLRSAVCEKFSRKNSISESLIQEFRSSFNSEIKNAQAAAGA